MLQNAEFDLRMCLFFLPRWIGVLFSFLSVCHYSPCEERGNKPFIILQSEWHAITFLNFMLYWKCSLKYSIMYCVLTIISTFKKYKSECTQQLENVLSFSPLFLLLDGEATYWKSCDFWKSPSTWLGSLISRSDNRCRDTDIVNLFHYKGCFGYGFFFIFIISRQFNFPKWF